MISGTDTFTANYYQFRNLDLVYGLNIIGTPSIVSPSLTYGDFQLAASGTMMTVAGSVITQNPQLVIKNVKFATSSGMTGGTNVTATSTTGSFWKFNQHYGNRAGEAY